MKRKYIFLILIVFLSLPMICFATNDVVKFTSDEYGKIYYESDEDSEYFIYHDDMIPARVYVDILDLKNETSADVTLYLKAEVGKIPGAKEDEFLDNIEMKLYLDDVEIYSGKAKGLDYNSSGVNLQDAIILKEFKKNESSTLRAETKLSNNYDDTIEKDSVSVNWKFYAQVAGDIPVEVANVEGKSEDIPLLYTVGGIVALALVGVYIYGRHSGRWLLIFAPWTRMKLEIPKIELKEILHPKNGKKNKIENIMIKEDSDMPDVEEGNLVLIGKIDSEEDAVFNDLHNVEIDDYIYVLHGGYAYKYKVYKIYDGREGISDLYKKEGIRMLTLATCKENPKILEKIYLAYFIERK